MLSRKKILVIGAIVLTIAAMAALVWTPAKYEWARLKFSRGEYEQAKEILSTLAYKDSIGMGRECDYRLAENRFFSGDYAGAKEIYDRLEKYKQAEIKALACAYMLSAGGEESAAFGTVQELFSSLDERQTEPDLLEKKGYILASMDYARGDFQKALPEYEALGDFADSTQWMEECRRHIYEVAVADMNSLAFQAAVEKFQYAAPYGKSELYGNYCRIRLEKNDILDSERILAPERKVYIYQLGMYYYQSAYIYVPEEINEDTKFLVYFAGGDGKEPMLFIGGVYRYIQNYAPNAILVFYENSGSRNIPESCQKMIRISKQLSDECGVIVHDLVVAGSSTGCYTALHAAAAFYTDAYIEPKAVLTLDTGMEWKMPIHLSAEERAALAEAGTKLYLFEQDGVGTDVDAIYDLVASGDDVTAVYCKNRDHDWISRLAYENGVFSWAMGEFDELNDSEYTLVPLHL